MTKQQEKYIREITQKGEMWRNLPKLSNYLISSEGRIYSLTRNKLMQIDHSNKYDRIQLYDNRNKRHFKISRLVATAFCPGADQTKIVHHINCDHTDNRAINLIWATPSQHKIIHRAISSNRKENMM